MKTSSLVRNLYGVNPSQGYKVVTACMDSSSKGVGKYAGLALLLPISTLTGFGMGYGLDMFFHTGWLRYVFLALGTVSGFIELIRELLKDSSVP